MIKRQSSRFLPSSSNAAIRYSSPLYGAILPKNNKALSVRLSPSICFAWALVSSVLGRVLLMPNGMTVALLSVTPNSPSSSLFIFAVCTKMWWASEY